MKSIVKAVLNPFRRFAAKFVNVAPVANEAYRQTILYKAGRIIARSEVEGDYFEFGVFAGNSFINAYYHLQASFQENWRQCAEGGEEAARLQKIWNSMRFFAFDSFQGLPKIEGADRATKEFSAGDYMSTEQAFLANLRRAQVPLSRVITVPGWFDDTCTPATVSKHQMRPAAIIHIDCDLYSSTKTVLNFVTPFLQDGTIIVFDDWFHFRGNPNLGEQKAFHEWRGRATGWVFSEYQKEGAWRMSFIASRTDIS
jgi:hypothetical protein